MRSRRRESLLVLKKHICWEPNIDQSENNHKAQPKKLVLKEICQVRNDHLRHFVNMVIVKSK